MILDNSALKIKTYFDNRGWYFPSVVEVAAIDAGIFAGIALATHFCRPNELLENLLLVISVVCGYAMIRESFLKWKRIEREKSRQDEKLTLSLELIDTIADDFRMQTENKNLLWTPDWRWSEEFGVMIPVLIKPGKLGGCVIKSFASYKTSDGLVNRKLVHYVPRKSSDPDRECVDVVIDDGITTFPKGTLYPQHLFRLTKYIQQHVRIENYNGGKTLNCPVDKDQILKRKLVEFV